MKGSFGLVGRRKYEKNTEKYENGPKVAIFVFFGILWYFQGPTQGGGFCFFGGSYSFVFPFSGHEQ